MWITGCQTPLCAFYHFNGKSHAKTNGYTVEWEALAI